MAWSTRELANLAGTTVNTIRHYHRVGLLDVPEREYNGYKQYEVSHLVRLLRIRRLVGMGVPLAQIEEVSVANDVTPELLKRVHADLDAQIAALKQSRSDIEAILRDHAPADTPAGFESVASRLSAADSSILHIYKQLYDDDALADMRKMVDADTELISNELAELPANADEVEREKLAHRLAPILAKNMTDYPWLNDPAAHLSKSVHVTQQAFTEAMLELYNPAQLNVLVRANELAHEQLGTQDDGDESDH